MCPDVFSRPFLGAEGKGHRLFVWYWTNVWSRWKGRQAQSRLSQGHWARLRPARGRGLGSDPPGTCHAEDLGFPPGESPKFNYLKASHLWLLRTAQTSWPVFVGYKSEHLLTNHHHSGFERIPFPRSLLNPDQGRVRLPLPLAGTTFREVPRAWQQPRSQWREAPRWVTGDALP